VPRPINVGNYIDRRVIKRLPPCLIRQHAVHQRVGEKKRRRWRRAARSRYYYYYCCRRLVVIARAVKSDVVCFITTRCCGVERNIAGHGYPPAVYATTRVRIAGSPTCSPPAVASVW